MNVTISKRLGIAALYCLLAACAPAESPSKPIDDSLYTQGWQFMSSDTALDLAAARASQEWIPVVLPHTPRIESPESETSFQGDSWYRKTITPPPEWQGKQISLVFDAAMNIAEIWLNGEQIATHQGGYLPFHINLSDKLRWDSDNELLLRLDNRDDPLTGLKPLTSREFKNYGGLYRPVHLHIDNDLYITDPMDDYKPGGGGILVSFPEVTAEQALIDIQTNVANAHYDPKQFRIVQRLMWGDKVITDQGSPLLHIEGKSAQRQTIQLILPKPQLWSPNTPNLYHLVTRVYDGNSLVDEQSTRIGIRKFTFEQGKLYINGEQKYLRAVNRYQEYPFVGFATSAAADYRDVVHIKSAGFDAVRLTHYPQSTAFLDAADELGLVVINAIPGWKYFSEDPAFQAQAQQTCRDLIRRDRNHPSVLAWECSLGTPDASTDFINTMNNIVREELPDALTAGSHPEPADISLLSDQNLPTNQDTSTSAFWITIDDIANSLNADNYPAPAFAHAYGTMFKGYSVNVPNLKSPGIMSLDRQPQYAYYFFQSQREPNEISSTFKSGPMVFIASEWTEESPLSISVFSNTDEVELLLNGKSLGKKIQNHPQPNTLMHPPFLFTVEKFIPGELKAVAYYKGKIVTEHKVVTPGKVSSLRLQLNTSGKSPEPGTKDLLFVYAHLTDSKGNPVRDSNIPVTFTLQGDAKLISPVQMFTNKGTACALIEIGESLEGLKIIAQTEGLQPAKLTIP